MKKKTKSAINPQKTNKGSPGFILAANNLLRMHSIVCQWKKRKIEFVRDNKIKFICESIFCKKRSRIQSGNSSEMFVGLFRCLPPAWCADEITFLDQKRFVHFFNRSGFFPDRSGNGGDAHRPALEFVDDRAEDANVHF